MKKFSILIALLMSSCITEPSFSQEHVVPNVQYQIEPPTIEGPPVIWPEPGRNTHDKLHHDFYFNLSKPWLDRYVPGSCCSLADCDGVRAWFDEETQEWVAIVNRRKIVVPDMSIVRQNMPPGNPHSQAPDGNAHICIRENKVLCFVRPLPKI